MNESIPIATLSGITSLTNLLAELPLPRSSAAKHKESLFSNPNVEVEAKKVLNRPDPAVIHQIKQALRNSSQEQINLKDEFNKVDGSSSREGSSVLLQAILNQDPNLFNQQDDQLELEDLLGIPPLCHTPLSPQLSPNQPLPMTGSPMYAGSPPGLAQVHSPYRQAVHQSPPEVGSPMQQSMSPYAPIPQPFSPHRAVPTNIMSPNHQGVFNTLAHGQMSPLQGNSSCQPNASPIKTRRMRNSLPSQSPTTQISPPQSTMQHNQCLSCATTKQRNDTLGNDTWSELGRHYTQAEKVYSGGYTMPQASPRSRNVDPSLSSNLMGAAELGHLNLASPSTSQYAGTGYNSISALEALASSNGFALAPNSLQNTSSQNSSGKTIDSTNSLSAHQNNHWSSQQYDGVQDFNVAPNQYNVDTTITETIDSGISLPAAKKGSRKKHADRSLSKTNKHEPELPQEQYEDNMISQKDQELHDNSWTNLNHRLHVQNPKECNSDGTIDLNNTVDHVYIDGTIKAATKELVSPSGYTPLKELQLCIPKLVITKIKERRGSKEIETHSVRTIMPGEGDIISVKKKRRRSSEDLEKQSDNEIEQVRPKKKKKMKVKKPQAASEIDDLMESSTFKRFSTALENLFEFDDECGVSYMAEVDDEEPASESLASRTEIYELYAETAKLRSLGVTHQVPSDQLMRLIAIMERHVRDGLLLKLNADQDDDEEQKLWRDLCLDRMIRSVESSLVVLNILTSPSVPKQLYVEEVIERVIRLVKFHLQNNIFPEYDPVYRDPDSKDPCVFVPKSKRTKSNLPKVKLLTSFYNKMCELVSQLGDLVDVQTLTDTTILQISSLGTSPFFVENVSDLQHSSLKLVRSVFRKYVKHRDLILEDIFASLQRLPSTKRNMRSYRLNGEESIQMVTALVLQLIQCSIRIPDKSESESTVPAEGEQNESEPVKVDRDIIICNSFENGLRTAQNFLSMFLNKCSSVGKDEEDFRPLFENFLQDLLLMLNKPEWPTAEVLLTLLGKLLIVTLNNKSLDVSLRVSSIDYLGVVAAHLRKDGVTSHQLESDSISDVIVDLLGDTSDESEEEYNKWDERSSKRMRVLKKALLHYLTTEGQNDAALLFAKRFYIAQWIRDAQIEIERAIRNPSDLPSETIECINSSFGAGAESIQKAEEEKEFLHDLLDDRFSNIRSSQNALDYDKALLVSRYLGSSRSFSKSFDGYLGQILRVLNENVVAIRTKAMKALSAVVSADPSILSRDDMQKGVHTRLVDMSTSVREAAVELIGRFVLNKPEIIHQYYDMIVERILDTGISVRKRVIKILRDICINQPDFPKVTEICVKIIRRIADEEGIKELVTKVFQQMWFTPEKGVQQEVLLMRVVQMTEVVSACGDNTDWFEQLLENLLRSDEDSVVKSSEEACFQIVDCLVENILRQEESVIAASEGQSSSSQKLVASLTTLYLMSKIKPQLLINHVSTLQPYLSTKCSTQGDYLVIHNVARILELVVPLMEHPSETFLASLEEDLMRLTVKHGQTVVQSCISCLGSVVNRVTHNIKLVKDYFQKYYGFLVKAKTDHHTKKGAKGQNTTPKPTLLRSLFTLGLLCKHFDFDGDVKPKNQQSSTRDKVFAVYIYFCKHEDEEVQQKAISGLGFFCMRYAELLMKDDAKCLYQDILSPSNSASKLKWQVLKNFQTHLLEEERRLRVQDHEWKKQSDKENLKELGDAQSGQTSAVMQVYLKDILGMFFHRQSQLRTAALTVVTLILRQGLVHPVQCVPYLIAAGTDVEQQTRLKSDQQLTDIDNKYSGFIQMKALAGTKMSFDLQKLVHEGENEPIRGFRKDASTSLLSHMYSVVRTSRQPRRSLLQALLRMFDDHKKSKLDLLLYVTDNLAYFPYSIQEEPLFIMHHIDTMLSVSGAHLLQAFKEAILPKTRNVEEGVETSTVADDDDDDATVEAVIARIPQDNSTFAQHCHSAQKSLLLLLLKEHLKELFSLTDSKCHKYSPSAPSKAYDKTVSRKPGTAFQPEQVIDYVSHPDKERPVEELAKMYCEFKGLMMKLDPQDEDSDDSNGRDSPAVDLPPVLDAEGNVIVKPAITPKPKVKQRKTPAKGRKTPPVSAKAKGKPKPKKKRKKITLDGDSDVDEGDLDPDFK